MDTSRPPSRVAGFSLIELLVVLAILSIVAIFVVPTLGNKSVKAVRSGLQDLKASLQQARGLALSNGQPINVHIVTSGSITRMIAYKLDDTGAEVVASPLMSVVIGSGWNTYAQVNSPVSGQIIPDEGSKPIQSLPSLTALGFSGWANPILPDAAATSYLGFSAQGTPQLVDKGTKARVSTVGGTWIGIAGLTRKDTGLPYGAVFVTDSGLITAYYKPDALNDTGSNQWQRLE